MMFRDTGSNLFHKFNMLLSITHDSDGQGHWQLLKGHSVMQLWAELTGYTWRLSHRRCPKICCRGPSLFVEAKSKQCRKLPCSNVNYGGLKENTSPASDNQGNTLSLLIMTPEGEQCISGLGSPARIKKECFPPVWTWKAWSFYPCNEQIKLQFWINLQRGYFQTSIHFCPWFCSVQYLYP